MEIKRTLNVTLVMDVVVTYEAELGDPNFPTLFKSVPESGDLADLGLIVCDQLRREIPVFRIIGIEPHETNPYCLNRIQTTDIDWTIDDAKEAAIEGWEIISAHYDSYDRLQVSPYDSAGVFQNPDSAMIFICRKAEAGSALHIKALQVLLAGEVDAVKAVGS